MYYKAGLAGQWPFLRVFSAIGRRMAKQRWPMAERAKCEDPRLFSLHFSIGASFYTLDVTREVSYDCFVVCYELCNAL